MKRCAFLIFAVLFLPILAACRVTLEADLEQTWTPRHESALGQLAYIRGGDVWVIDLNAFPDEEPRRLTTDGCSISPRWSPSGGWLLFQKGSEPWLLRADGSAARPLPGVRDPQLVAWSPVEDRLAYVTESGNLALANAEGMAEIAPVRGAVSESGERVERFAWHPNGEWLACQVAQVRRMNADAQPVPARQILRVLQVDGRAGANLLVETNPMETAIRLAGWSGEGTHVLLWRGPASESIRADGLTFASIPVSGGHLRPLAVTMLTHEDFAAPQPLSSQLALVIGSGRETWRHKQLVTMDVDGQSPRSLSGTRQVVTSPAWSHGGGRIAYAAMPAAPSIAGGGESSSALDERRIWVVKADGTGQHQITDDPAYRDEWPLWSADGQHILFARIQDGRASLWLGRHDGSQLQQVVEELSPATDWSGDYGHVEWRQFFDYWTGLIEFPERPVLLPTEAL